MTLKSPLATLAAIVAIYDDYSNEAGEWESGNGIAEDVWRLLEQQGYTEDIG